jgi:ribonuclease HI
MPPVSDSALYDFGRELYFDDYDVIVYCDGSADSEGNAGWAAVYFGRHGKVRPVMENDPKTDYTSQGAEIRAAILGLRYLTEEGVRVLLISDSNYVVRCFNEMWLPRWRRKGWMHKGEERPNRALWETLEAFVELHEVSFRHTPGHEGEPANEHCDMLANYQRARCKRERMVASQRAAVATIRESSDRRKQRKAQRRRDRRVATKRGKSGRGR